MTKTNTPIIKLHARDRRPLVAKLFTDGEPLQSIAEKFGVPLATIKKDIQIHYQNQKQLVNLEPQEQISIELACLNRIETAAWNAQKQTKTKDDDKNKPDQNEKDTTFLDHRLLTIIRDCSKYRAQLLSLDKKSLKLTQEDPTVQTIHVVRDQAIKTNTKK